MLSLMVHTGYEGSDHGRKNLHVFFLQSRHLHIPHESSNKTFYCLNDITLNDKMGRKHNPCTEGVPEYLIPFTISITFD